MQKIRFETSVQLNDGGRKMAQKQLYLRINELVLSKMIPLLGQEEKAQFDQASGCFRFPRFEFMSDQTRSRVPVPMKSFVLEVMESDPKNPKKTKLLGKTQFLMRDALNKGSTGRMSLFLLDEKNRYLGKIEISQCSARRFYSFFDLQLRCQLNLVPILAVDFSIGNIVENEDGLPGCLHSRKAGHANDYISAMMAVSKAYSQYAKFMLAYGVGARTMKGNGAAVEICSMTGDFLDPFVESQAELLNCYEGTLRTIKIAGPVNYKAIVKFVCDLA